MVSDGESLAGLWLVGQKYFGANLPDIVVNNSDLQIFRDVQVWLDKYFNGENPKISDLALAPIGNEFRQSVWKILCEIPYGGVKTYGEIASELALQRGIKQMSAQAIGGAVGHNPISIIIPCHRVVGKNGKMTGYAGGIDTKIQLLKLEGHTICLKKNSLNIRCSN